MSTGRIAASGSHASGALTEISAIGNHDAYTYINPHSTKFKQFFRRISNFARAEADVGFQSSIDFDRTLVARIPRAGDALGEMYLSGYLGAVTFNPDGVDSAANPLDPLGIGTAVMWCNGVGYAMIRKIWIEIGSQKIDEYDKHFLMIWEQHTAGTSPQREQIGFFDNPDDLRDWSARNRYFYAMIPWYFSQFHSLVLPLIALQYHEVSVMLELEPRDRLIVGSNVTPGGAEATVPVQYITGATLEDLNLTCNYYYFDTMERRINAQQPHENLFTQHQYLRNESVEVGALSKKIMWHFNHPCLSVYWFLQETQNQTQPLNQHFNYGINDPQTPLPWRGNDPLLVDPFASFQLELNGHLRFGEREATYFRMITSQEVHSNIPIAHIYSYHFGLDPQSSDKVHGSINLSRVENQVFICKFKTSDTGASGITNPAIMQFVVKNYNVSKIAGGMFATRHAN